MFISNSVEINEICDNVKDYVTERYRDSLIKNSKVIVVRYKGNLMLYKADKKYEDKLRTLDFRVITEEMNGKSLGGKFPFVMLWLRKPIDE